jgi:hypothetical protein
VFLKNSGLFVPAALLAQAEIDYAFGESDSFVAAKMAITEQYEATLKHDPFFDWWQSGRPDPRTWQRYVILPATELDRSDLTPDGSDHSVRHYLLASDTHGSVKRMYLLCEDQSKVRYLYYFYSSNR